MSVKKILLSLLIPLFSDLTVKADALGSLIVNEIMVGNVDVCVDPSWNYGGWVELYNPSYAVLSLKGCWISDDPLYLQKVQITEAIRIYGRNYLNLWFGHHDANCPSQIDFKLDTEGGTIYISDSKGNLKLSQDYPASIPRASWARKDLTLDEWGYVSTPTPEKDNNPQFCDTRMEAPEIDQASQVFTSPFVATVRIPDGATLRYTTDGSCPTLKHGQTSEDGIFSVSSTTVLRLALFRDGFLGSPVVTRSYILKDKDFNLPILSVTTDPDNLYSDEMGIFVKGVNGVPGMGQSAPCNWNMDWDRPANFEYLDMYGTCHVNQETEICRAGKWSRAHAPYSFKVHSTKLYEGKNTLDYPFFEGKPHHKHKTVVIRNGGNGSNNSGRCKDALLQKIVLSSGLNIDAQEFQPVVHYINGVYKGTMNMREPNNKQFVYSNYGLDEDEIDMFEVSAEYRYEQNCGTAEAFNRWYNLSKTASNASSYSQIEQLVDIDEYCNYMAVELYLTNHDWPNNNLKCWRPITEDGKFRHIMYDLDYTLDSTDPFSRFENKKTYSFSDGNGELKTVTLFLNMLKNETFRRHFIDAFCLVAGSVFEAERCKEIIHYYATLVYPMQILKDNGYGKNTSPWDTANKLVETLKNRPSIMFRELKNYTSMKLGSVKEQQVKLSTDTEGARLRVNGQVVPTGRFDGKLFPPVTLKAEAPGGYRFAGWKVLENGESSGKSLIVKGAEWTYYDKGSIDSPYWMNLGYSTSAWKSGAAPLGYGSAYKCNTILNYGSLANKHTTYYLRKLVTLSAPFSETDVTELSFDVDDGFVLYVNGKEAGRYNMPEGDITYGTVATEAVGSTPSPGKLRIDASLFKKGINVIGVEVHNCSTSSSDLYWDAKLTVSKSDEEGNTYLSTEEELPLPAGDVELMACFAKSSDKNASARPITINEVSAGNSVCVNEYFKKNDWIELYNTTDHDIDLAGMYLSDDATDPCKYCISNEGMSFSTIIPAHGFRVVWCDGLEPASQLHAPFKLSNKDDAYVLLTASDESWTDTLVYCSHGGRESVGRFPDGSSHIYHMSRPTIDSPNQMTMYTTPYMSRIADSVRDITTLHDNGLALQCTRDCIRIRSEKSQTVTLSIYSEEGICEMTESVILENGRQQLPIPRLRRGIYVMTLRDGEGNFCSCKYVKP